MKVLLGLPPSELLRDKGGLMPASGLPPLGLAGMAAVLEESGIEVGITDAHAERLSWRAIERRIQSRRPDVVGVTLTTDSRASGFRMIRAARKAAPDAWIVAGGPHVTFAAEDTLAHTPALDAVCRGEGEYTLLEAVRALARGDGVEGVTGLSYRQDGEVVHNAPRAFIEDLDALPPPARHLLDMRRYHGIRIDVPGRGPTNFTNMISSRGCPIGCCFCSTSAMWGRRFRPRSAAAVVAEIESLVREYDAGGIWFFDDSFAMSRPRVHAICDLLLARGLDLPWICDARVDTVDEPLLAKMKAAGCYSISFGVETGSARILDEVLGKHITLERVREVKRWCERLDIRVRWLFMVGMPSETKAEALRTLDLMAELGGDSSLGVLKVYPGTPLEGIARERGILPASFSWAGANRSRGTVSVPAVAGDAPLFTDTLSWEDTADILLRYARMNRYPLRGRILGALRQVRSPADLGRLLSMGLVYLRQSLRR